MPAPTNSRNGPPKVLVVCRSPVNRVVVSGIVERSGLKPIPETHALAGSRLAGRDLELVIIEVGVECDDLLLALRDHRRGSASHLPRVILLSTATSHSALLKASKDVDAIIPMPITTETLQPVIARVMAGLQG